MNEEPHPQCPRMMLGALLAGGGALSMGSDVHVCVNVEVGTHFPVFDRGCPVTGPRLENLNSLLPLPFYLLDSDWMGL